MISYCQPIQTDTNPHKRKTKRFERNARKSEGRSARYQLRGLGSANDKFGAIEEGGAAQQTDATVIFGFFAKCRFMARRVDWRFEMQRQKGRTNICTGLLSLFTNNQS